MLTFTFIGWLGVNRRRVKNHARLSFFAQAVALASNRDDDAVVQGAIQDGTRGDLVAEDAIPLSDRSIRGEQQAALLIVRGHELVEQMADFRRQGQVPDLGRRGSPLIPTGQRPA